ncbi:hypothetical protein L208DRAFT_1391851 [Tricholoma matsutake]|nr:hypothetical protein L208DRAFT_1391851 [Tricholoma matsutake 945]
MFDTTTGQVMQVAQHDAPIETVRWVDAPQARILATGSWDKTIKVSRVYVAKIISYRDHPRTMLFV